MEHGKSNRKFGRETKQRSALIRGLAVAIISKNRITTTLAKAKSLKVYIEKLVTQSKKNDLITLRYLSGRVGSESANKLIKEIGPKFNEQKGGYIRINKLAPRISDGSDMAIIEFIK